MHCYDVSWRPGPGCPADEDNKHITGTEEPYGASDDKREWERKLTKMPSLSLSLLTKETEITGDIVFLLPEKFTHKIVMAFNSSVIALGGSRLR